MDFSGEDKASGVKFCTVVHGRLGHGISHFGELCSPEAQIGRIGHPPGSKVQCGKTYRNRVPIKFARRVDVGSACVDIRPSLDDRGSNGTGSWRITVRPDTLKLTNVIVTTFGERCNLVREVKMFDRSRRNFRRLSGKFQSIRSLTAMHTKTVELIEMPFGADLRGPKETCFRWGPDPPRVNNFIQAY